MCLLWNSENSGCKMLCRCIFQYNFLQKYGKKTTFAYVLLHKKGANEKVLFIFYIVYGSSSSFCI